MLTGGPGPWTHVYAAARCQKPLRSQSKNCAPVGEPSPQGLILGWCTCGNSSEKFPEARVLPAEARGPGQWASL